MSYEFYNCDETKLHNQHEFLKSNIYDNDEKLNTYFQVLDCECGSGKTRKLEEVMGSNEETNRFNYLFVRERNADAISSAKRINEIAGEEVALAVNTDTYTMKEFCDIKSKLKDYRVVIISHEKYKELSLSFGNRKFFIENRQVLIIDEFLDMSKGNELQINMEFIASFETLLKYRALREQYKDCVSEIEDYLMSDKKYNSFFNRKIEINIINRKINALKCSVRTNLSLNYLNTINYTKKGMCDKIDELKQFYNQTCVVEGNIMYCTNRNYEYWFLPNKNIILDASARLNPNYTLRDIFRVQRQSTVFDHKLWKFTIIKTNTNKSSKERAIDFYSKINNFAEDNENTLFIGSKADEEHIDKAKYINHFGNILGSNEYKDLANIIIYHNPNLPYRYYVLQYLYFARIKFDNRNTWEGNKDGSKDLMVFRFKDKRFEEYRQLRNADQIYQAIKRINRNMKFESKVFIFNNDLETVERMVKMFKGLPEIKYYENTIKFEKTKQDEYNIERRDNRQGMQFIKLSIEITQLKHEDLQKTKKNRKGEFEIVTGLYSKQNIRNYLGITSKTQFSDKVLKDMDVMDYLQRHNIISAGQSLNYTNVKQ